MVTDDNLKTSLNGKTGWCITKEVIVAYESFSLQNLSQS